MVRCCWLLPLLLLRAHLVAILRRSAQFTHDDLKVCNSLREICCLCVILCLSANIQSTAAAAAAAGGSRARIVVELIEQSDARLGLRAKTSIANSRHARAFALPSADDVESQEDKLFWREIGAKTNIYIVVSLAWVSSIRACIENQLTACYRKSTSSWARLALARTRSVRLSVSLSASLLVGWLADDDEQATRRRLQRTAGALFTLTDALHEQIDGQTQQCVFSIIFQLSYSICTSHLVDAAAAAATAAFAFGLLAGRATESVKPTEMSR